MKRTQSFRRKLIPIIFLSAVVPLLILSGLSLLRLKDNMEQRYKDRAERNLDETIKSMEFILDKYETVLYDMCTDDEIVEIVEKINKNEDELGVYSGQLRREFSHICNRTEGVEGITIFTASDRMIFYDRLAASSVNSTWINKGLHTEKGKIQSYHADLEPVESAGQENYLFHLSRRLIDYKDIDKTLGTVVLSLNEDVLKDAAMSGVSDRVFICQDEVVVSGPDNSYIGMQVQDLSTEKYYVINRIHEKTGWKVYEYYPLKSYMDTLAEQIVYEFLFACAVIAVLIIMAYYLSAPLVKSVNRVVHAMNVAESGDFSVRIEEDAAMPVELNRISRGFNEMVEHIDGLMGQVKASAVEQKNAELQALEAQIDPHFLYNTLDTINWKAIEKGEMDISEMIGALSDILRYSVKNAGEEVTIRRELGWLMQYVLLQQEKIGKKVKVQIEVPENLKDIKIHKLMLQPFIENGIKYGFRGREGECSLLIHMEKEQEMLHIIIEDNGWGMTPETLNKLNDEDADMGEHMGIDNIRKRLKLYYSDEAGIYFESEQGKYARVHMFIPIHGGGMSCGS